MKGKSSSSGSPTRPMDSLLDLSSNVKPDVSFDVKVTGHSSNDDGAVHRNLKQRHVSMIAIGGTIGTGLFLGIGNALEKGGPLGLLLGYIVVWVALNRELSAAQFLIFFSGRGTFLVER